MRLIHRMLAAPMLAVLLLIALGVGSDWSLKSVAGAFERLRQDKLPAAHDLGEWQTRLAVLNAHLYRTINLIEAMDAKSVTDARQRIQSETLAIVEGVQQLAAHSEPEQRRLLQQAAGEIANYRERATNAITVAEGSPAAATMILGGAERAFIGGFGALQSVAKSVDADAQTMAAEVVAVSDRAKQFTVILTALAVAVSLSLAVWIARGLVRQLDAAVHVSESIAAGQLDVQVPPGGADEVGRLLSSLSGTVVQLNRLLGVVRESAEAIGIAASEIANGSSDLSSRTELTASGLQSTSSSMHEMSDTLQQSSHDMSHMHALAQAASTQAAQGAEVVEQVVTTMNRIQDGAKRIGDITGTIDAIAFQTNILALNAAVEAARAGENGRGFAVVASEVRALAQRSATAAREVKNLIAASTEMSEVGTQRVSEAGASIQALVDSVQRVGEVIESISRSTAAQSTALSRITTEIGQIDHMTQENSALAEQSAAASEGLSNQSALLRETIGTFRLSASRG